MLEGGAKRRDARLEGLPERAERLPVDHQGRRLFRPQQLGDQRLAMPLRPEGDEKEQRRGRHEHRHEHRRSARSAQRQGAGRLRVVGGRHDRQGAIIARRVIEPTRQGDRRRADGKEGRNRTRLGRGREESHRSLMDTPDKHREVLKDYRIRYLVTDLTHRSPVTARVGLSY